MARPFMQAVRSCGASVARVAAVALGSASFTSGRCAFDSADEHLARTLPQRRGSGERRWLRPSLIGALVVAALAVAGWAVETHADIPSASSPAGATTFGVAAAASSLQQQFIAAVRKILPSIVQIRTSSGLGSGVVFDSRGDVVTNAHVTSSSSSFTVTLADGRQYPARLVGSYTADDLAVITIGAHGARAATFSDSSKLAVGDIVLAAGNPLGLQSSITDGIVSALGRNVSEGGGIVLPGTIQTSAAINPGNSGGALVDLSGRVIGIPTLAAASTNGATAAGIGFAIPSNLVRDIVTQIIRNGHVVNSRRAALGVSVADSVVRAGALIVAIQTGGPADRAGIKVGDAIVAIGATAVPDAESLFSALAAHRPGQSVNVTLTTPDGARPTVTVALGELG
jgi:putative serine protease PepD